MKNTQTFLEKQTELSYILNEHPKLLGVELGKVRSVFSIPFWHIRFSMLLLQ